ncbi:MAG: ribonuclease P protein component [Clostridia bacterium]|nr:ribonuclease P protein component [Clostridia bacterium]
MKFTAITENHLYQKAYRNGRRKSSATVGVFVLKDRRASLLQKQHPLKKRINRIGISASKKVGGAVQRNRAKRCIREAYRQIDREIGVKTGYLIVITPYPKAAEVKMQDVKRDLRYCLARLDMLADGENTPAGNKTPAERQCSAGEQVSAENLPGGTQHTPGETS